MNHPRMMYLTILVSVQDILTSLRTSLPETESVDLTVVIKAMLEKIFFDNYVSFGKYSGPFGAYRVQTSDNLGLSDFDIDLILNEIEVDLLDLMSGVVPTLDMQMKHHYYHYPRGDNQPNLYIYVPMDPTTCPIDFKQKLLPYEAIRYTHS